MRKLLGVVLVGLPLVAVVVASALALGEYWWMVFLILGFVGLTATCMLAGMVLLED